MRTTLIKKIAAHEWRILRWVWDAVLIVGTALALAHVVYSLHAMPIT
jgi:hypothetical protein